LPGLDFLLRSFKWTNLWPASSMLTSALYFIAIFPFELEVELCVEKLVTGTDFSYLSTFTALAPEGFLLKKLFLLA
jgi:hypothetical protein